MRFYVIVRHVVPWEGCMVVEAKSKAEAMRIGRARVEAGLASEDHGVIWQDEAAPTHPRVVKAVPAPNETEGLGMPTPKQDTTR